MDVIPMILSEEAAKKLLPEHMARLAECSTYVVKTKVKNYLNSPYASKEVKEIVRHAYFKQLAIEEFQNSEEVVAYVGAIQNLGYFDINPSLSIEDLKQYKTAIKAILDNEYAIPYIAPVRSYLIKALREEIAAFAKDAKDLELKQLALKLKLHSDLFRDSQYESHRGTIVKKIVRSRIKYEIILRGIEFLLDKKIKDKKPASWRYL